MGGGGGGAKSLPCLERGVGGGGTTSFRPAIFKFCRLLMFCWDTRRCSKVDITGGILRSRGRERDRGRGVHGGKIPFAPYDFGSK